MMSVSQVGPAVLKPALKRLDELTRLEHDWDTYGALPLTSTAIDIAESMMREAIDTYENFQEERAAPYTVMPIADGGVSIEWRGPSATLELDIGPSGDLSYLLISQSSADRQFEECSELSYRQALELVRRVIDS
jgi:hypothetical protein